MGGRGSRSGGPGAGGGLGGATITPTAGGGVTITPNANPTPPMNAQALASGGAGVSDAKTHTTYFTPADYATVSPMPTDGYRRSPRTGKMVPVGYYQTGDYANVNGELRDLANGKISKLSPQTQKVVDAMDRNMRPLNAPQDSVRWTDTRAIADNLGMSQRSTMQDIVRRLSGGDVISTKNDYTSSSWDPKANAVAGNANRFVKVNYHYAKGALVQYSPTRKEGEMVGARGVPQRYSNARIQRMQVTNAQGRKQMADVLVVDAYVD